MSVSIEIQISLFLFFLWLVNCFLRSCYLLETFSWSFRMTWSCKVTSFALAYPLACEFVIVIDFRRNIQRKIKITEFMISQECQKKHYLIENVTFKEVFKKRINFFHWFIQIELIFFSIIFQQLTNLVFKCVKSLKLKVWYSWIHLHVSS